MKYLALIAIVLVVPAAVFADFTVNIPTNADALVMNNTDRYENYGSYNQLFTYLNRSDVAAFYLGFDTADALPSGAVATGAKLWLRNTETNAGGGYGSAVVAAYTVDGSWTESELTWSNQPVLGGLVTSNTYAAQGALGWVSWDVTSAWSEMDKLDFMFKDIGAAPDSYRNFTCGSKEKGAGYVPYLEVTYDLPQQGGGTPELPANVLLSISMIPMGLAWLRRRGKR